MATELENLRTRRQAITDELAALDSTQAGGRPNVSGGTGTVDHVNYRMSLYNELTQINQLIASLEGPWEIPMEGMVS